MDVEDYMLLFLSSWVLISALAVGTVDVFLTLTLIGLLITLEVGSFFLSKEQKESLKPLVELLLVIFAIIVMKKVYEVLSG
ncbi:MAG TPA: hypothetical protein HA302_07265 [Thermococcaceae archaeon]|uniref:Multisubunit sodium/hydrogen antiporter, MnhG subunit n=1 Tax=Thermococcus sibiricus (strain DSM 12597 / MM 739) TaxID=604354 RepID=C6A0E1_THESM|nr:hypothetical protein [Thermococcus sibiricus]ACS89086.1 hypothetical protein TSIB_0015 [Thermococcus sibiricus MM 739]HII67786.1 hypothetical protein [Thermococcaceae archaeon]